MAREELAHDSPGPRCGSCGGPTTDGDLCSSCQQAFSGVLSHADAASHTDLVGPEPATQTAPAVAVEMTTRGDEDLWSQLMNTPGPPSAESYQAVSFEPPVLDALDSIPDPIQMPVEAPIPAPSEVVAVGVPAFHGEPAPADPISVETQAPIQFAPIPQPIPHQPTPQTPRPEHASAPKAPRPAAGARPSASPASQSNRRAALGAALGLVTAISGGVYWFQTRAEPAAPAPQEEQQVAVATEVSEVAPRPAAVRRAVAAAPAEIKTRASAAPASRTPAMRPKTVAPAPRVAAVPVRKSQSDAVAPPPQPTVVAEVKPAPEPPPAPAQWPFFETKDVNEAPRIETRVDPQLPDALRTRPLNEIVVVRILVSQGGHPSHVSLLRRSRTGPELDDAVIAAVNRWTFAPAKKRGEAVSCWLNVGVPIGGTD